MVSFEEVYLLLRKIVLMTAPSILVSLVSLPSLVSDFIRVYEIMLISQEVASGRVHSVKECN